MSSDFTLKKDIPKLLCLVAITAVAAAMASLTSALLISTLISIVVVSLVTPLIASLERRGLSRMLSISLLFVASGAMVSLGGVWATQKVARDFESFRQSVPAYAQKTLGRFSGYEASLQEKYPFLENAKVTEKLTGWAKDTGQWFIQAGPGIMGDLFTCLFIVPILSFFMLKDGFAIRKRFFDLVPNRFFESSFMVLSRMIGGLSDYIRAKLIEAFLVGAMVAVPLLLVGAPYAIVQGLIAGITNIIPYIGPILGAIPGILIVTADPSYGHLLWPVILIYLIANLIDMVIIFPLLVAKLVDMHPVVLIIAVIAGQQYYGLIGMLISIPVATALKVIAQEIHWMVYEQARIRSATHTTSESTELQNAG
jgi:putative permease